MAKIQLGKPPKSFPKELSFPMLDGTVGSIKVTYIYRTRKEFAVFVDSMLDVIKGEAKAAIEQAEAKAAEVKAAAEAGLKQPDVDFGLSNSEANAKKTARQVDYIMGAVEGWNLDIPFSREAVEQLADEVPQAITEIINAYSVAMNEGRLGN